MTEKYNEKSFFRSTLFVFGCTNDCSPDTVLVTYTVQFLIVCLTITRITFGTFDMLTNFTSIVFHERRSLMLNGLYVVSCFMLIVFHCILVSPLQLNLIMIG